MRNEKTIRVDHAENLTDALSVYIDNEEVFAGIQSLKQITRVLSVYDDIEDYGELISAAISNLSPDGKYATLNLYNLSEVRKVLILFDTGMTLSEVEQVIQSANDRKE